MKTFSESKLKSIIAATVIASSALAAPSASLASPTFQYTYLKAEKCSMGVSEFWWVEDPRLPSIPMERCMFFVSSKCTESGGVVEDKDGKKFCKLPAKAAPAFEKMYGPSKVAPISKDSPRQ